MPRVFIPQVTERFDHTLERRVPTFDLSPAATFGDLIPVLDAGDNPLLANHFMGKMKSRLEDFAPGDFLLATGDPVVIAACSAIIAAKVSTFTVLKWDRKLTCYIPMQLTL